MKSAECLEFPPQLAYKLTVMHEQTVPKLTKMPFLVGDAMLLAVACFICLKPIGPWELAGLIFCVAGGAGLSILPFILEYRTISKLAETEGLTTVVAQIQHLETIGAQIAGATNQWQSVQDQASKTAVAAREVAERMTSELKSFSEFLERTNNNEKATLRLEVEKLHRGEAESLQVLVRMLDHVYALQQGALRSGQPNVIEQVNNFQYACRDAARRIGLAPFVANEAEPFDAQRHQLAEEGVQPPPEAIVGETLATGFTFQGRLLRPALVRLRGNGEQSAEAETPAATPLEGQDQLPLEPTAG